MFDEIFFEWVLFWVLALGAVGSGLMVVIGRSPVASALSLASSMVFGAALMVQMRAYFIGVVQILVYAGAVIVLFLFIIMLMDLRANPQRPRALTVVVPALAVCLLLAAGGWMALAPLAGGGGTLPPAPDEVRALGNLLFTENLLPLQVTGVLLFVVMIGAVVLCRPGSSDGGAERP